jgi:hypothetical protein
MLPPASHNPCNRQTLCCAKQNTSSALLTSYFLKTKQKKTIQEKAELYRKHEARYPPAHVSGQLRHVVNLNILTSSNVHLHCRAKPT